VDDGGGGQSGYSSSRALAEGGGNPGHCDGTELTFTLICMVDSLSGASGGCKRVLKKQESRSAKRGGEPKASRFKPFMQTIVVERRGSRHWHRTCG
jgi:hypothetical protein